MRLAAEGWRVAIADWNPLGCLETLQDIQDDGGTAQAEPLDVTGPEQWLALRNRLEQEGDALDLLVNNAGVAITGEVDATSLIDWRWPIDVNLWGTIYGCHFMLPWMRKNPDGAHILNVASMAGLVSLPTMGAYNVTKAGIVALSETLYVELLNHNIGVTVLCPGFLKTNLMRHGRFASDEHRQLFETAIKNARYTPEEMAAIALRAVAKRQLYAVPAGRPRRWWRWKRWFPRLFYRLMARSYARGLPKSL